MSFKKIRNIYRDGEFSEKLLNKASWKLRDSIQNTYRWRSSGINFRAVMAVQKLYKNEQLLISVLQKMLKISPDPASILNAEQRGEIINQADDYLQHNFEILGSGKINLNPIDWHTDFKSGYRWKPKTFYKDYVQVEVNNNADVKIPRELSRCHHFLTLAEAYLLTKDERYTEEFINQISDWIYKNPCARSINWGCTMDVAIRAINWIWSFAIFINSPKINLAVRKIILVSLFEHGMFIYLNPEKSPVNNHNHYLSDLAGQIYLGLLFEKTALGKKWLIKGVKEFYKEVRLQILPSGVDYERSINYHRLVTEIFTAVIIPLQNSTIEIPFDIYYRLEKMYEFIMHYIKPDGTVPVIGDQDDGRILPFSKQQNIDHRYLLSIGAAFFKRRDFKKYSNGYNADCLFLLGDSSKEKYERLEEKNYQLKSKSFKDAGFFIMRNNKNYMFINISGKSHYNEIPGGTHTHSDLLSFELCINGKSILVDPGSYIYSADSEFRKLFRSTPMHNTVTVDGENQNVLKKENLWDFERNALPKLNMWESNDFYDFFDGEHNGYFRLNQIVLHRRTIHYDKENSFWEICDYLTGEGKHHFELFFHFADEIDFRIHERGIVTNSNNLQAVSFSFESIYELSLSKEENWVSNSYGKKKKAKVLRVSLKEECPVAIKTTIREIKEISSYTSDSMKIKDDEPLAEIKR